MRFYDVWEFVQDVQCTRQLTVAPENDRARPPLSLTFLTIESPIMSVVGRDAVSGGDIP